MTWWAGSTSRISRSLLAGVVAVAIAVAAEGAFCASPSGGDPNSRLFEAVHLNDLDAAQDAVRAGADIRAQNEWGLTAADVALDKGYFPVAKFLMSVKSARAVPSYEGPVPPLSVPIPPKPSVQAQEPPAQAPPQPPELDPAPWAPSRVEVAVPPPAVDEPADFVPDALIHPDARPVVAQTRPAPPAVPVPPVASAPVPELPVPAPALTEGPTMEVPPAPAQDAKPAEIAAAPPAGEPEVPESSSFLNRLRGELRRLFKVEEPEAPPVQLAEVSPPSGPETSQSEPDIVYEEPVAAPEEAQSAERIPEEMSEPPSLVTSPELPQVAVEIEQTEEPTSLSRAAGPMEPALEPDQDEMPPTVTSPAGPEGEPFTPEVRMAPTPPQVAEAMPAGEAPPEPVPTGSHGAAVEPPLAVKEEAPSSGPDALLAEMERELALTRRLEGELDRMLPGEEGEAASAVPTPEAPPPTTADPGVQESMEEEPSDEPVAEQTEGAAPEPAAEPQPDVGSQTVPEPEPEFQQQASEGDIGFFGRLEQQLNKLFRRPAGQPEPEEATEHLAEATEPAERGAEELVEPPVAEAEEQVAEVADDTLPKTSDVPDEPQDLPVEATEPPAAEASRSEDEAPVKEWTPRVTGELIGEKTETDLAMAPGPETPPSFLERLRQSLRGMFAREPEGGTSEEPLDQMADAESSPESLPEPGPDEAEAQAQVAQVTEPPEPESASPGLATPDPEAATPTEAGEWAPRVGEEIASLPESAESVEPAPDPAVAGKPVSEPTPLDQAVEAMLEPSPAEKSPGESVPLSPEEMPEATPVPEPLSQPVMDPAQEPQPSAPDSEVATDIPALPEPEPSLAEMPPAEAVPEAVPEPQIPVPDAEVATDLPALPEPSLAEMPPAEAVPEAVPEPQTPVPDAEVETDLPALPEPEVSLAEMPPAEEQPEAEPEALARDPEDQGWAPQVEEQVASISEMPPLETGEPEAEPLVAADPGTAPDLPPDAVPETDFPSIEDEEASDLAALPSGGEPVGLGWAPRISGEPALPAATGVPPVVAEGEDEDVSRPMDVSPTAVDEPMAARPAETSEPPLPLPTPAREAEDVPAPSSIADLAEDPEESWPSFMEKVRQKLRSVLTRDESTEVAEAPKEGGWAPTVTPGPTEQQPGLMDRLVSGVKRIMGQADAPEEAMTEVPPPVETSKEVAPEVTDRPSVEVAEIPGAAPSSSGENPFAPLVRLGIKDVSKYISDEPYDPKAPPETGMAPEDLAPLPPPQAEGDGRLPPAADVPSDPFAPVLPAPSGGEPPKTFDSRFDRGEALAPLTPEPESPLPGEKSSAPPPPMDSPAPTDEGKEGDLFAQLGDILQPLDAQPETGETSASDVESEPDAEADLPVAEGESPEPSAQVQTAHAEPGPGQWKTTPPWADGGASPEVSVPEATGQPLNDVTLALAGDLSLGRMLKIDERVSGLGHGKACISKLRGIVVFCVVPAAWGEDVAEAFDVNSILYQGRHAVMRYDDGRVTNIQALFPTESFDSVVAHFTALYGPPTDTWIRRIAPLASERRQNPTVAWRSAHAASGKVALLEIRVFDDTRGGFPDVKYGAVLLHYTDAKPIFPRLSTLDLMVMRPRTVEASTQ